MKKRGVKSHVEAYYLKTQLKKIKWTESGTHMQRKKRGNAEG